MYNIEEESQYTSNDLHFNGFRSSEYIDKTVPERVPVKHLSDSVTSSPVENSVISINELRNVSEAEDGAIKGRPFYIHRSFDGVVQIAQGLSEEDRYYLRTGSGDEYFITSLDVFEILAGKIMQREELPYTLEQYPLSTLGLLEEYPSKITKIKTVSKDVSDEWLVKNLDENNLIKHFL